MEKTYQSKFENMLELHYFMIGHSLFCVTLSLFSLFTVRKNFVIDRRQYFILVTLSAVGSLLYLAALIYVVSTSQSYFLRKNSDYPLLDFIESLLDLLDAISRNRTSFFFTVVMNFVLLYGIFCLNICSS